MTNSLCKTSVLRIYQEVIDDVISSAREIFLEEGVDEQGLQELKQTWETKLMATKAVQPEQEEKPIVKKVEPGVVSATNGFSKAGGAQPQQQQMNVNPPAPTVQQIVETKMVPIQITLPPQPGTDGSQRVLTIQVPSTALQGNQLQKVLTGPVITATMGLPATLASSLLQQHVNAAFNSQAQAAAKIMQQTDGAAPIEPGCSSDLRGRIKEKKSRKSRRSYLTLTQTDGPIDTSDEDDEVSDDDNDEDDLDEEKDDEDHEIEEEGGEEEPLNSEDDVSEEDPSDLFDTDNIVVCQYDKIIRNKNKWKFYLKDGIMNLKGFDYVFQKANGDADW